MCVRSMEFSYELIKCVDSFTKISRFSYFRQSMCLIEFKASFEEKKITVNLPHIEVVCIDDDDEVRRKLSIIKSKGKAIIFKTTEIHDILDIFLDFLIL